jgi:transposase
MDREALEHLSQEDLIALILALSARVAELEAKLNEPPKTPDNSSLPPSKGEKPNCEERRTARRKGRPGTFRTLAEHPNRTIEAYAEVCPRCRHALTPADQPQAHAYDHVELPPIRPVITRVNRHRGICPCCRTRFSAAAPEGLEPGSPFGPNLVALIVHLHITQAISFERLVRLMDEVFGVVISEGAIANILARAEPAMRAAAEDIAETVRASPVIASDETSARVRGKTPACAGAGSGGNGCCSRPPRFIT